MADRIIGLENASRTLSGGARVLHEVDLELRAGESLAIVGRSGSGKSTLLSCLGLLAPFDRGTSYHLGDTEIMSLSERSAARLRATSIGFVLQNSGLVAHLSALENVELPLMHSSSDGFRDIRRRAFEQLDLLDIGHLARRRPAQVSGGERQRIAIARALVIGPRLILADEPTGALDEQTGALVLDLMLDLVHRTAAAMIVVTHDSDVSSRADRTLHVSEGRLHERERRTR
ncbi:ABC transporter ATP-binding protein [Microbacterium album]|uniref:ABC transporter ATP-binding protein n=1 Tax=Microbacterium album TaxID=2053191 RepID=UPI00166DEC64|nr:ATP-binding cassette domain-containing protein [Microbacterium album]